MKKAILIIIGVLFSVYLLIAAEDIDSKRLLAEQKKGAVILDVRSSEELAEGRIPRSVNLDFFDSMFQSKLSSLSKDTPYVTVCRSGRRSGLAALMMKKMGFREVYNYEGGMLRWNQESLPIEQGRISLESYIQNFSQAIEELEQGLSTKLKSALSSQGVTGAVAFCSVEALPHTSEIQRKWELIDLKRVGTRNRNPKNLPNQWEAMALKKLQLVGMDRLSNDIEVFVDFEADRVRAIKPIQVKPLCLSCHGEVGALSSELKSVLKHRYPKDEATGYRLGELRGFFHLSSGIR